MARRFVFVLVVLASTSADAALLDITATSAAYGELGWFRVDDAIFATTTWLVASQFEGFYFADPLGTAVLTPSNVPADTGYTYFGQVDRIWTVIGGSRDSLTSSTGDRVWIYRATFMIIDDTDDHYFDDVVWSTQSTIPEPTALAIWGALGGFLCFRFRVLQTIMYPLVSGGFSAFGRHVS